MSTLLEADGQVAHPSGFSFAQLGGLPEQIADVSKVLPGREGGGVRLRAVLDKVQLNGHPKYITLEAMDGKYSASVPLEAVLDRGIIVYRLGDAPIPESKGGPIRFFIQDVEHCGVAEADKCANVKHLRRIILGAKGRDTRPETPRAHKVIHEHEE